MASLSRWLKRRRINSTKTPRTKGRHQRLWLEALEERMTPDANTFQFALNGNQVQLNSTNAFQFTTLNQGTGQEAVISTSAVTAGYSVFGLFVPAVSFPSGISALYTPAAGNGSPTFTIDTTAMSVNGQVIAVASADTPFEFQLPDLMTNGIAIPSSFAVPIQISSGHNITLIPNNIQASIDTGRVQSNISLGGIQPIPGLNNAGFVEPPGSITETLMPNSDNSGAYLNGGFLNPNTQTNVVPLYPDTTGTPGTITFQVGGVAYQSSDLVYNSVGGASGYLSGDAIGVFDVGSYALTFTSTNQLHIQNLTSDSNNSDNLSIINTPVTSLTIGSQVFQTSSFQNSGSALFVQESGNSTSLLGMASTTFSAGPVTDICFGAVLPKPNPGDAFDPQRAQTGAINITNGTLDPTFGSGIPVPQLQFGGLTFISGNNFAGSEIPTSSRLTAIYNENTAAFDISGTADLTFGGASTQAILSSTPSAGFVVTNGAVTSAAFSVQSLQLGSLVYTPAAVDGLPALSAIYDPNSKTYSFLGGATLFGVSVEFGTRRTSGIVLDANGNITAASFFFNTGGTNIAGVPLSFNPPIATYNPTTSFTSFNGTGTITVAGQNIPVDGTGSNYLFGYDSTHDLHSSLQILGPLTVGPFTLTPTNLIATFDANSNNSSYFVTGTGTAILGGTLVPVTLTQATGIVITNGAIQSFGFTTPSITVNGVEIDSTMPSGFVWSYNQGSSPASFNIQGTFNYTLNDFQLGPLTGNFTYTSDPTLGGVLAQVGSFTVGSQATLDNVIFQPGALSIAYTIGQNQFVFSGTGSYFGSSVEVGGPGEPSITITNGNLQLTGFTPPQVNNVVIPGIGNVDTSSLTQTVNPDFSITFTGSTSIRVGSAMFGLNIGGGGMSGLVVKLQNNQAQIVSFGAQLTGSFTVGSVKINVESLTFQYVVATQTVDISGKANAVIKAASQTIKLELSLGDEDKDIPGIELVNGQLKSAEASISADFSIFGVSVHVINAGLAYDSTDSSFGIFGTVTLTTAKKGGKRMLDGFGVSLGSGPDDPGIEIVDGSLQSLDIKLDGTVNIGPLTAESKDLELKYDAGMGTLQITGGLEVEIAHKFTGEVSLIGDGLLIDTSDGSVELKGLEIKVADVKFGVLGIDDLTFEYEVDDQGNTTISGSGMVSLPGGITVGGSFGLVNGQLSEIGISFARTPGIPIGDIGYITSISGEVTNLNDLANFQFKGTIVATVGPSIKIYNKTEAAAVVTGTVTINSQMMELDGDVEYLGGLYGEGSGKAIIYFTGPNLIHISGKSTLISIPPYGSVLTGEFDFDLDKSGDVTFNGALNVIVPSNIPKIGGKTIGTLGVYIQLRPEQSASNSYAQFTASVTVIFHIDITLKVDLTGDVQGHIHVSLPIVPDINAGFSFYLPGTRTVVVDNGTASKTYVLAEDNGPPPAPPPTLALTASPVANTPEADIDYTGTTSLPSSTTIDLYADTSSSGYQGQLIASDIPFKPGQQEFTWNDFAEFAAQPYDPSKPIYFYGVIKDGTNAPVFTSYSAPVIPPDYDPSVQVPSVQATTPNTPVIFGSENEDPILITDPMAPFDASAQVQVTIHANRGSLDVTNFVDGVTSTGLGSGVITLVGTADAVNAELDGLTYMPEPGSYFDDSIEVAVSRYQGEYLTPITSTFGITFDPLSITLGDPNAGDPTFTGTPQAPGTLGYTLGGGYQPLLGQLQITDAASDTIRGATVVIGSYVQGKDVLNLPLSIEQQTGISARFDPSTGTLYLTGSAPLSKYQFALDRVLFSSSGDPGGETLTINVGDDTGYQAEFTIAIVGNPNNSPPTIIPGGSGLFYTQGDAPTAIDPLIAVSNPQGGNIVGVVINFTPGTYVQGEDELVFTAQNGITGSWDPAAGALTLSGAASASDYTLALESVQYVDLAGTATTGIRKLTVNVINDNTTNDLATTTLLVLASATPTAPQPPIVGITVGTVPAANDTSAVVLDPGLTVTDAQSPTIQSATVAITSNYSHGEDLLNATALFGGIQESFDVNTGVLTLTGEAPVYYYQLALASVTYTNLVQARSGSLRTLTFEVNDGLSISPQNDLFVSVEVVPVVQAGFVTTEITKGQTGFVVDPTIAINYSGATLSGATVAFNGTYFADEDQLQFTNQNGITGSFNSTTGVLTLSGIASVADYQAALQSVQYFNSRFNPIPGGRQVDFTVSDGSDTSQATSAVVNVDAVDVPPTLAPIAGPLQVVEGGAPITVAPAFSIRDPDAALPNGMGQHTIYGATVMIENYVPGEDILTFTPSGNITGSFNATQGTITLTGADTAADYAAVLQTVQYQDVSEAPVTTPRVLHFIINDGETTGGDDETAVTINVQSLMNPPIMTAGTIGPVTLLTNAPPVSLGLGALNFVPPSSKEPSLVYTVTQVPDSSLGQVVFGDGSVATVGQTYTLAQIQSATFEPTLNAHGQGSFTFTVAGFNPILSQPDPASLTETIAINVNGVNATTADQLYVAQIYRDLLGRNPDANGLNFWSNLLNAGTNRSAVVLGIESSTEYRTDAIQALYQQLLHRKAETQGRNFYLAQMAQGETIDQVRVAIAASPEYYQSRGGATVKGYVDALYSDLLGRGSDSVGESFWIEMLATDANLTAVTKGIASSNEAIAMRTTSLYQELLRRSPDPTGLAFNAGLAANSGQAAVIENLAGSDEYFQMYAGTTGQSRDLLTELSAAGLIAPQTQNEEGNATTTTGFSSVGILSIDGQGVGGGTLIASRFVLTAAHVVDGRDPSSLTFTVGGATYNVAQVFEYPGYDPAAIGTDGANDIAILELTRSVTNVTPSPINRTAPAVGDLLTLVGFGARDGDAFGVKHTGTTPIDGVSGQLITWTFANNSEDDTVVGDSGSPEFIERNGVYYVASVTSGGTRLDSSFGDNAYNTRVDAYQTWIDAVTGMINS